MKIKTAISLLLTAQEEFGPDAELTLEVHWNDSCSGDDCYTHGTASGIALPLSKSSSPVVALLAEREF